jgi:hypothetical protein
MERHTLMGGKLHFYKRENSRHWQCSTYLAGKHRRRSTREESLSHAKDIAEDLYFELRGKHRAGQLDDADSIITHYGRLYVPAYRPSKRGEKEKTFREAATLFLQEFEVLTQGQRNRQYVQGSKRRLNLHLLPFFGDLALSELTSGKVQEYRLQRAQNYVRRRARTQTPPDGDGFVLGACYRTRGGLVLVQT